MLLFSAASLLVTYATLRLQHLLPLNPANRDALPDRQADPWRNTRYVVERVERLAHRALATSGDSSIAGLPLSQRNALRDLGIVSSRIPGAKNARGADELDDIEATVTGLSTAVTLDRADASRWEQEAVARATDIETLLGSLTTRFTERTEEAQPASGAEPLDMRLARLLLRAQGGTMLRNGEHTTIELTSETASRVVR